jgi:EAL domain-containing protein (putative c-di-GMP-specific phosphodiesterase class I)
MTATTVSAPQGVRRVLIIDDEPAVLRVIGLLLERHGFSVASASNARDGLALLAQKGFDVVLSDIIMPELSGLDFLRELRQHDLDVPVILMTAGATLDSALDAIEYGAQQYLLKPVEPEALVHSVGRAVALGELARMKRTALAQQAGKAMPYGDRATLEAVLTRTFATIHARFQPMVSMRKKSVLGYEALMRCDETLFASYGALLLAAERVGWRTALSRTLYQRIAQDCSDMPDGALLFVNIHPLDAQESLLTGSGAPLEPIARSVVLDVRESVAGETLGALEAALPGLRGAGFRISIDNVGTGTSGLEVFSRLMPDFAKLDRLAFAGIEKDPKRKRTVRAIYAMFASLEVPLIAQGVETVAERDALLAAGADLAQGNLFGAPSKGFETPAF